MYQQLVKHIVMQLFTPLRCWLVSHEVDCARSRWYNGCNIWKAFRLVHLRKDDLLANTMYRKVLLDVSRLRRKSCLGHS